jgi:hypothetical protein
MVKRPTCSLVGRANADQVEMRGVAGCVEVNSMWESGLLPGTNAIS